MGREIEEEENDEITDEMKRRKRMTMLGREMKKRRMMMSVVNPCYLLICAHCLVSVFIQPYSSDF